MVVDLVTAELDQVHERIAGRFTRAEPRPRVREYLCGLVAGPRIDTVRGISPEKVYAPEGGDDGVVVPAAAKPRFRDVSVLSRRVASASG